MRLILVKQLRLVVHYVSVYYNNSSAGDPISEIIDKKACSLNPSLQDHNEYMYDIINISNYRGGKLT